MKVNYFFNYKGDISNIKEPLNADITKSKTLSKIYDNKSAYVPTKKSEYIYFSYSFICKSIFCTDSVAKSNGKQEIMFKKLNIYLFKRFDVVFYLQEIKKNNRLRTMLLNKTQVLSLDYMKKPNLKNKEEIKDDSIEENSVKDQKLISGYFIDKLKNNEMSAHDEYLFKNLQKSIKLRIKKNLTK